METIWRPVKGYEGLYEVSNTGLVRRLSTEKVLKNDILPNGYVKVRLCKNGRLKSLFAHRLVAQAFPEVCGEWFEGCQINHKNELKTDNRAENLETCTRQYNRMYGTGIIRATESKIAKGKRILQYDSNDRLVAIFASPQVAVNMYGKGIYYSLNNQGKTAYGYTFKYYDDIE